MTAQRLAAWLLIGGSMVFFVGAAIGVPRVFMVRDPDTRLRLLRDGIARWRAAQPLYALGPLLAAIGPIPLATGATSATGAIGTTGTTAVAGAGTRIAFLIAAVTLLAGAVPWAWLALQRGRRIGEFVAGALPGWPFTAYILLTVGGLAALATGLLVAGFAPWVLWLTIGADALFLVVYLRTGDIPPFVFYLLLTVAGVVVW